MTVVEFISMYQLQFTRQKNAYLQLIFYYLPQLRATKNWPFLVFKTKLIFEAIKQLDHTIIFVQESCKNVRLEE